MGKELRNDTVGYNGPNELMPIWTPRPKCASDAAVIWTSHL